MATNSGEGVTWISDISSSNLNFTTDLEPPLKLSPGESVEMAVTFAPTVEGERAGVLTISSNAYDHPIQEISLHGEGVGKNNASALRVYIAPDGDATDDAVALDLRVTNHGETPLSLSDYILRYSTALCLETRRSSKSSSPIPRVTSS